MAGPRRLWLWALMALGLACLGRAHDPGISTAQGEWRGGRLELTTGFAPADVEYLLPSSWTRVERWTQAEFDAARDLLVAIAPKLWEVRIGAGPTPPVESQVELLPGDNVSFRLVFTPPAGSTGDKLLLRAHRLAELPEAHRQFVVILDQGGSLMTRKLLSRHDDTLELPLTARAPHSSSAPPPTATPSTAEPPVPVETRQEDGHEVQTMLDFLKLGVEHIWTGYDHLLFLFALLLTCRRLPTMIGIVTSFTLAHTLTLALATLDLVSLPSRLVEAAIAASIVVIGLENLLKRDAEPRGRWAVTFAFGLIHGFGFASVLRDLGVSKATGVLMPLFTFNLGVELGQIAIAAVVLPLIWWLRRKDRFVAFGVPALSAAVTGLGVFWLIQRLFFA